MLHVQTAPELPRACRLLGPELLVPLRSPSAPSWQGRPRPGAARRMLPHGGEDRSSFWFCFRFCSAEQSMSGVQPLGPGVGGPTGSVTLRNHRHHQGALVTGILQTLLASCPLLLHPGQDVLAGRQGTTLQSGTRMKEGIDRKVRPCRPGA